jgi:hypothetical protein
MPASLDHTNLHRTAKYFMDNGRAESPQGAVELLKTFRLTVHAGTEVAHSAAHQTALLTLVNAASRILLAGVEVVGLPDAPCICGLAPHRPLADAVRELGGRPASGRSPNWPSGARNATVFDPSSSEAQPHALVFNVSTPGCIAKARASCEWFDRAFRRLMELHGISPEWPGFDVMTLNPAAREEVDRVIELKSSGVCSRIQEMSWNEWKSARSNQLRQRFYLYLVGNLRSDLNGSKPFVRTIRDPFEQLLAEISLNKRVERKIQLAVNLFREAEHLDLTVHEAIPTQERKSHPQTGKAIR